MQSTGGKEQAGTSSLMAAESCFERAEGDTSKDNVKKDKKKKKERTRNEEAEAGTEGQEQTPDTTEENTVAERGKVEGKQSSKSKKSKRERSDAGEASAGDQVVTRDDKKGKKEHPAAVEESSQKQTFDITVRNLAAEKDKVEGKESCKSKTSKHKRTDAGEASAGDHVATREDKKRKKEHPVVLGESSQKQTLDAIVENLVVKRDEVEGKQSNKSKKSKHERANAGEASASDQVVAGEDKKGKKKHSVVLEKSRQPKNTSKGENGEVKERGKEGNESGLENASAVGEEADVDGKKKKKSKEGKREEKKEKEKAARSKNKGKWVSFADSTEVFENEGGDGEGGEGGKKKNKGKRVSFADSAEVFENEGGDGEGGEGGKKKNKNKGKRVSFADSTEVFENEGGDGEGGEGRKKKRKKVAQSKKKDKRVSFADSAEVFSIEGGDVEEGNNNNESKLVHGQRFTPEEDATLMEAIRDFIEMKQLGEKGFEMFRSARQHKELRRCWEVIGKSLPHRPHNAIYCRARVLLSRSEKRKWTQEEKDYIRRFVEKNGTEWITLARELGKCNIHVKDTWRRIKSENLKKGHWTQDEHQKLFDLVNLDLRMKAHQIKNPDNRKLRDNISWEAISDKLTTRNHKNCCMKWYDTLASPMVRKGIWADVDDYLLVEALQKDDAVCVEDVNWDNLLDHRSGEVCRQRWNQMVRGLGGHREKPFIEQVDVLSMRYCPEMIEYRT